MSESSLKGSMGSLSSLLNKSKNPPEVKEEAAPSGKAPEAPANAFIKKAQVRKSYSEEDYEALKADIKDRGIKQPIKVATVYLDGTPVEKGKFFVRCGHTRLDIGEELGIKIPYLIDNDFDEFDQYNENEKRSPLTNEERYEFASRKINEGFKKKDLVKRMQLKSSSDLTELLSIGVMPPCVRELYDAGIFNSPSVSYRLNTLFEKFPNEVEAFCKNQLSKGYITVQMIKDLKKELESPASTSDIDESDSDDSLDSNETSSTEDTTEPKPENPDKIKKPLVMVSFGAQSGTLLLNKRAEEGYVWIKTDSGEKEEVAASDIQVLRVVDAKQD